MKEIFMMLINCLVHKGELTEANMYIGGKFSKVTIECEDGIYEIAVMKKDKEN